MKRQHPNENGTVIVLFVLLIPILFGMLALALDYGRVKMIKSELQIVADSTALEAARFLAYPSITNQNSNYVVPNWGNAVTHGNKIISLNPVNNAEQLDVFIQYGYWNINHKPTGLQSSSIQPSIADKPAISVEAPYGGTSNTQGINLIFAALIGQGSWPLSTTSTAGISAPGLMKQYSVYPIVISKCLLDNYWNSDTGKPLIDPNSHQPYQIALEENNGYDLCSESMSWTFFQAVDNHNAATLKKMMQELNPENLNIGDSVYLSANGMMTSVVRYIEYPIVVILPVVNTVNSVKQNIIAFCAFNITSLSKNKKQIIGNFTEVYMHPAALIGNGNGVYYGVLTPPVLFN